MSNPSMLVVSSVLIASFVADYKTTRSCIDRGKGREVNPLMGQSRAQELGVGIALTGITIWSMGELKKEGRGLPAFIAGYGGTLLHTFAAYHNSVVCSD